MRRIAVINQKGGVGKTTTTANLGAALALAGHRILLVDLDPQGHLSLHYGLSLTDESLSLYDVLTDGVSVREVIHEVRAGIHLAPADIHLAGAEAELVSVMGREVVLREALDPLENEYDFVLVDCPPSVGVLTVNALSATNEVLIPLQAQFFALQGFAKLLEKTVTLVHRRINPRLNVMGVILCMHEPATRLAGEVVQDLEHFLESGRGADVPWSQTRVFEQFVRRNIKLAEAGSFGQTIFDYAPRSNGAQDYLQLAREIFPDAGIDPEMINSRANVSDRMARQRKGNGPADIPLAPDRLAPDRTASGKGSTDRVTTDTGAQEQGHETEYDLSSSPEDGGPGLNGQHAEPPMATVAYGTPMTSPPPSPPPPPLSTDETHQSKTETTSPTETMRHDEGACCTSPFRSSADGESASAPAMASSREWILPPAPLCLPHQVSDGKSTESAEDPGHAGPAEPPQKHVVNIEPAPYDRLTGETSTGENSA